MHYCNATHVGDAVQSGGFFLLSPERDDGTVHLRYTAAVTHHAIMSAVGTYTSGCRRKRCRAKCKRLPYPVSMMPW